MRMLGLAIIYNFAVKFHRLHIMNSIPFIKFIADKRQRIDWIIIAGISVVAAVISFVCYPYPGRFGDTGQYVMSAVKDIIYYRPFGFPKFLQLIHSFSDSIQTVRLVQWLIYSLSAAWLIFTVKYFFPPKSKALWFAMLVFIIVSPHALHIALDFVLSDAIFAGLVYCLLAASAFIVFDRSIVATAIFAIAFYFTLEVRFSALIFPVVFLPMFLIAGKGWLRWAAAVGMAAALMLNNHNVKAEMKAYNSLEQYSTGFDGWQIANNALHIIPHIDLKPERIQNREIRHLYSFCRQPEALEYIEKATKDTVVSTFMWQPASPLKVYTTLMQQQMKDRFYYHDVWVRLGSGLFKDFGYYFIMRYPLEFMQYFYLPNMVGMFYPIIEPDVMQFSSMTGSDMNDVVTWYNLPADEKLRDARFDIYSGFMMGVSQWGSLLTWAFVLAVGIWAFMRRRSISFSKEEKLFFWGVFIFGVLYYASTIFASPVVIRYWIPMKAVQFIFMYVLLNKLITPKSE
jgi:hypothetical protein